MSRKLLLLLALLGTQVNAAADDAGASVPQVERTGTVTKLGKRIRSNSETRTVYQPHPDSLEFIEAGQRVSFVVTEQRNALVTEILDGAAAADASASETVAAAPAAAVLVSFANWVMTDTQRQTEIAHGCDLALVYPEVDPTTWDAGNIQAFLMNNNWQTHAVPENFGRDPRVIIILKLRNRRDLHSYVLGRNGLYQNMVKAGVLSKDEARLMGYPAGKL